MTPAPKRRWFQFGLAAVAVLALTVISLLAWRAWCLDWIRQRNEAAASHTGTNLFAATRDDHLAPWMLRLFGAHSYELILVEWEENPESQRLLVEKFERLFPEAVVEPDNPFDD